MTRYLSCAAVGFAMLVAACAAPGVTSKVDAAVVGLTTAESLALIYTKLPRCDTKPAGKLCSDAAVVQQIKDADMIAYKAVKAAENNPALLSLALDAVTRFQAAIPKVTN